MAKTTRCIMNKVKKIYKIMIRAYGPQGWWPLTERYKFIPEHKGKKPDTLQRKFEIIIGAILTQNTAWKNVEKAITELNRKKLLDLERLKALPEKKLAELIKPSGYYNQKAKKLRLMIKFLKSNKEVNRKNLLSIWGVGPETADSILLYAYNQPFFVIDAYTKRIFSRIGLCKEYVSYENLQGMFHKGLEKNVELFKEYHALLVEHGRKYCRTKPLCKECILRKECNHRK